MSKKNIKSMFLPFAVMFAALLIKSETQAAFENPVLKFYTGYHDLGMFYDGLAPVKNENEQLGYIDINGNLVIDYQFDTDKVFYSDRLYNNRGASYLYLPFGGDTDIRYVSKWDVNVEEGVPNTTGTESPYIPSGMCNFKRGYASVSKNGEIIIIDTLGNKFENPFPKKYHNVWPFYQNIAVAQKVENGLLGYIDRDGNEITDFQFLCASHFKDGVAKAITAVPYKNGVSRYVHNEQGAYVSETLNKAADMIYPEGRDVIDVYLDTGGSVLSWSHHVEGLYTFKFRPGDVFELTEVSEGLILKNSARYGENNRNIDYWYEYVDGTLAFKLSWAFYLDAKPFGPEKIAKVVYKDSFSPMMLSGYIDNQGNLLRDQEIEWRFPDFFLNIVRRVKTVQNPQGGIEYYVQYFLVGLNDFILMDCTDRIIDEFAKICVDYWNISYDEARLMVSKASYNDISLHRDDRNRNLFYIYMRYKASVKECIGYIVVEWQ